MEIILGGGFVVFIAAIAIWMVIQNLIYVASTNEALIFAGAGGKYKVVKGGRRMRLPLFETVHRIDLTLINIEVSVKGAFSKGGIPLDVTGVANVKVSGESPELDNAVQRFLGLDRRHVESVARDTLEGSLRGIVATMTPEDLNESKSKFERALESEAREGLQLLGLTLDNLKIQQVSDRVGYLSAIGEKDKAELFRKARIAEAVNRGEATVKAAENRRVAEVARIEAEIEQLRAEAERRILNAKTAGSAMIAEAEGRVRALVARARADLEVQRARIDQVKLQLQADVVQPAEADMEAAIRKARGEAASIAEEGRAVAEGMRALVEQWQAAGDSAREIVLMQKLDAILSTLLDTVDGVRVERFALIANGGGAGGDGGQGGMGDGLSLQLMKTLEELKSGTGFDAARGLARLTGQDSPDKAKGQSKAQQRAAEEAVAKANAARADAERKARAAEETIERARAAHAQAQQAQQQAEQERQAAAVERAAAAVAAQEQQGRPRLQVTRRSEDVSQPGPARARLLTRGR